VCHQRVGDTSPSIEGDRIYDRACLPHRHNGTTLPPPVVPPPPTTLAVLLGCALSFDPAGCEIPLPADNSSQHERFTLTCFEESLQRAMPVMRVNHQRTDTLSGLFVRVAVDARRLMFRFLLDDNARAREVLARIRGGQIRGVSIGFRPEESGMWDTCSNIDAGR
jgi:hypothetical protein